MHLQTFHQNFKTRVSHFHHIFRFQNSIRIDSKYKLFGLNINFNNKSFYTLIWAEFQSYLTKPTHNICQYSSPNFRLQMNNDGFSSIVFDENWTKTRRIHVFFRVRTGTCYGIH